MFANILEQMFMEKTTWELESPNEDFFITLSDISVDHHNKRKAADLQDLKRLLNVGTKTDLLYTHINFSSNAINNLLSGRDAYFRLEKIAILSDNTIKLYFNRRNEAKFSVVIINTEIKPCFTATLLHNNGDIRRKSCISVDTNHQIHIENIW